MPEGTRRVGKTDKRKSKKLKTSGSTPATASLNVPAIETAKESENAKV